VAGAGNYYRLQATLGLNLCFTDQIIVKYANIKANNEALRGTDVARGRMWPLPGLGDRDDQKSKVLFAFTPLLQELRGPPVVRNDTLGVHIIYFDI
jgi:hypothetical protein